MLRLAVGDGAVAHSTSPFCDMTHLVKLESHRTLSVLWLDPLESHHLTSGLGHQWCHHTDQLNAEPDSTQLDTGRGPHWWILPCRSSVPSPTLTRHTSVKLSLLYVQWRSDADAVAMILLPRTTTDNASSLSLQLRLLPSHLTAGTIMLMATLWAAKLDNNNRIIIDLRRAVGS